MKNLKHTPGPWGLEKRNDGSVNLIGDGKMIASSIEFTDLSGFGDSSIANARLVACAPEMLEALEAISVAIDLYGDNLHDKLDGVQLVRDAIAKARGEK